MATPGVLEGCVFVIDKCIPLKKKVELIKMIRANGGASVYSVSPKATHLVTTQEGYCDQSTKVESANEHKIHIISKEFVVDSVSQKVKLDEKNYHFSAVPITQPVVSARTTPQPHLLPPPGFRGKPLYLLNNTKPNISIEPQQLPYTLYHPNANGNSNHKEINNGNSSEDSSDPYTSGNDYIEQDGIRHFVTNHGEEEYIHHYVRTHRDLEDRDVVYNGEQGEDVSVVTSVQGEDNNYVELTPQQQQQQWREGKRPNPLDKPYDHQASTQYEYKQRYNFKDNGNHINNTHYEENDDGCKIFVGGIMLDDLEALGKTRDGFTHSPEVLSHIEKLKQERLSEIVRIFTRFGTITKVKQFLENKHMFISFDNQKSANAAIRELKPLEARKRIIQDTRERLRTEGRQSLIAPRVQFYVRWPNRLKSTYSDPARSESERYSSRSDSESSWRRRSSYGPTDTDPGYGSNSSMSAFSHSEYDSESDHFSPRNLPPDDRQPTHQSDPGDSRPPAQEIRVRRVAGLKPPSPTPPPPTSQTTVPLTQTITSITPPPTTIVTTPSAPLPPPPSIVLAPTTHKDWLWLWSKVIMLFQVVAIMAIVYFYNRGGF